MLAPRALALALAALLVPLAGCASSLSERNFTLASNGDGFDKGGIASFKLEYDPRALPEDTSYTIESKYVIEKVKYDRVGSFFEEYETANARDLDVRFFVDGEEVPKFTFTHANRTAEMRLKVPADLATDRYILRLSLLHVGEVASNEFRVADP